MADKNFDFGRIVDSVSKELGMPVVALNRNSFVKWAVSTGSLAYDLIIGGGWAPGRLIILFGQEQSGKSTLSYFALKEAINQNIPTIFLDHEGSTDADYLERILGIPLSKLQGSINDKGEWVVSPLVRYIPADIGEKSFRFIHRILRELPDKVVEDDKCFFVYDCTKENKDRLKGKYSLAMFNKTGRLWVEAEDGRPQLLIFIDSLPSMIPESRDEDDESNPIAKQARMMSENLPLVKGMLSRKRVTVIATNQTRIRPTPFGGEYETCGEAVRFYSDVRTKLTSISSPNKKAFDEEPSVGGGMDRYRWIKVKTVKNKLFSPFRECTLRIWFEEKGKPGRGIDPVHDTIEYLKLTDQIKLEGRKYVLNIGKWKNKAFLYSDLKKFILESDSLRNECKGQLMDSTAFKLYFDKLRKDDSGR